ncbi:uncharacterized protein SCHCODRAFT_02516226 [Schizophyllum commune H4-8]|nr:uncharacterized protein SCHCODRAFT_02516226 [Schizophyllum commune H4-8]KAI5887053.1 hypothetical protein SCHCODRAFT_02516226 [Schizophyllum commune H4-8]
MTDCGAFNPELRTQMELGRLLDTIEGFHLGSHNLTGRHRPVYEEARARFDDLERACVEFARVATVKEGYRPLRLSTPAGVIEAVEPYCIFDPPNAWEEFTRNRGMPCYNYTMLVAGIQQCREVIEAHPEPRFQKLCLLDLPPELLDHIMNLCHILVARVWNQVCKTLQKHASQRPHTYCDLTMAREIDWPTARDLEDTPDELEAYLRGQAFPARDALVRRMERLLSRPDILERIRTLTFGEDWTHDHFGFVERMRCPAEEITEKPYALLAEVLGRSKPGRVIYRAGSLTTPVWKAIAAQPSVRSAALTTRLVDERPDWPPAPNIINLHICIGHAVRPVNQWDIIPLCPSAVYLKVISIEEYGSVVPDTVFGAFPANPMAHIQRLDLQNIAADSLISLADAIQAIPRVPLTHLSIAPKASLVYGEVAFPLVEALQHAPDLRVLHISGLHYAWTELLEFMGESVPGLEALVLEHSTSERKKNVETAHWPCPAYEYAPLLGAFPRLRHLGLNMDMSSSHTPRMMEQMEKGYDGTAPTEGLYQTPLTSATLDESLEPDSVGTTEGWMTGKLFAIHAKNLKSLALHKMQDCHFHRWSWSIERDGESPSLCSLSAEDGEYIAKCMPMYHAASWELTPKEMDMLTAH